MRAIFTDGRDSPAQHDCSARSAHGEIPGALNTTVVALTMIVYAGGRNRSSTVGNGERRGEDSDCCVDVRRRSA